MDTKEPTKFDALTARQSAERLTEHATDILARRDVGEDLLMAAAALEQMVQLRLSVTEVASTCQDSKAAAELLQALRDCEVGPDAQTP